MMVSSDEHGFKIIITFYVGQDGMVVLSIDLPCFVGTIMTISKDRVKPSPLPDSWKLKEIFATGIVLGGYLALMTVIFFWAVHDTDFFSVTTPHFDLQTYIELQNSAVWWIPMSIFTFHTCRKNLVSDR